MRWVSAIVVVLLGSVPATTAHAHSLDQRLGPFLGSLLHPFTALDHALVFAAAGLFAGQREGAAARRAIGAFLGGVLLGAMLPLVWTVPNAIADRLTTYNVGTIAACGTLVALDRARWRFPPLLLASFGFSHGLENSLDVDGGSRSILSVVGIILAALALNVMGASLSIAAAKRGRARLAIRLVGSWIAAIGLMWLGFRLR